METKTINPNTEAWKTYIIGKLEDWRETWSDDETQEEEFEAYQEVGELIETFKQDTCNKHDYENILFHLWQIAEGEAQE